MPPCKRITPGPLPICRYPIVVASDVTESVVYDVVEVLNIIFLLTLDSTVHFMMRVLTNHAPLEELETAPQGEDERGAERQQHPAERERLQRLPVNWRDHGVTHTLGGVGERVKKRHDLKPLDCTERSPGIEGTAGKDQRGEHQRDWQWRKQTIVDLTNDAQVSRQIYRREL